MTRFVIGFGTGRCGTKSLVNFLNQHEGILITHENLPSFHTQWGDYFKYMSILARYIEPIVGNIGAAWISYIDRLVTDIEDLRLICLDRDDPEEVIESFHSYLQIPDENKKDFTLTYPVFDKEYSKEAVRRSVYEYLAKQDILLETFGDRIFYLKTEHLNNKITQDRLLAYVGIPVDDRLYRMPHDNKRETMKP